MYENFYGMRENPFNLAPDTHYFFCHTGQQEALNILLFALQSGDGFIKITGEVGTGKTLLCRELLNRLGDEYCTVYLPNPYLSPTSLRKSIAEELHLNVDDISDHEILRSINDCLFDISKAGKKVVICIDEAQSMPSKTLEALRLLSNLETEKHKLLQIVLFGQPELDKKLSKQCNRQLRQRIVHSYSLQPLTYSKVVSYLDHRLRSAGYNGENLFCKQAVRQLYKASGGIPRLINILSNKSLLLAFGKGDRAIKKAHVKAAIADTEGVNNYTAFKFGYYFSVVLGMSLVLSGYVLWVNII